jgi:DNA-binding FrmR family transcriptional regulator
MFILFVVFSRLIIYTPQGYLSTMQSDTKKTCLSRLSRIEGQVRGLAKMVADDRYCIDVITQLQAAIAALKKVEGEILSDHIAHCVEHAIRSGDKKAQREKVAELVSTLARARG